MDGQRRSCVSSCPVLTLNVTVCWVLAADFYVFLMHLSLWPDSKAMYFLGHEMTVQGSNCSAFYEEVGEVFYSRYSLQAAWLSGNK